MSSIPSNVSRLDPLLQRYSKENVTLRDEEVKRANAHLRNMLDEIMTGMKCVDETFKAIYKQLHYGGSYYENLRVAHPSEFDINLELQLPIDEKLIKIDTQETHPGFVKIRVDSQFYPNTSEAVRRKIVSWLENGYLRRDKIIYWLQAVVDKAMETVKWPQNVTVSRSTSGPAITLNYEDRTNSFAVDLVPVFFFATDKWPPKPTRQLSDLPWQMDRSLKWCVVPKCPRQDSSPEYHWRMSFYMYEKEMMNDQKHMKAVIKLMKLVRDKQNWGKLSSYYVKTIFMWEQNQHGSDTALWRKGLGYLFMHMLHKLEVYLQVGNIPFFWDQHFNMISHLKQIEIQNMRGRVTNLRRILERALSGSDGDLSATVDKLFRFPTKTKEIDNEHQGFGPSYESSSQEDSHLAEDQSTDWVAVVGGVAALGLGAMFLFNGLRKKNDN